MNSVSGAVELGDASREELSQLIGVVVIGRNEGDRLQRCLMSLRSSVAHLVYVDSGSTDGSIALARALGAAVVELDQSKPFTAARARNEGFAVLLATYGGLRQVFFVDGDCEVAEGWLECGVQFLSEHPDVGVVWGRRLERYPDRSIYNLLCDVEWASMPSGETKICGGDALVRVAAFTSVNGFRSDLICGEEPEMCVRLRKAGWRIWHLDAHMTLHDAAMYRFSQWWTRMKRSGFAAAQGAALHGKPPERHYVADTWRAWIWGACVPALILMLLLAGYRWGAFLLLIYPLQVVRLGLRGSGTPRRKWLYAVALVVSKFPEVLGQLRFMLDRWRHVQTQLIEYK
jgi:GT2 family glycosyltransferase